MTFATFWLACRRGEDEHGIAYFCVEFADEQTFNDFDPSDLNEKMEDMEFCDADDGDDWEDAGDDVGFESIVDIPNGMSVGHKPDDKPHFRVAKDGKIKRLRRSMQVQLHDPEDW